MAVPLSRQVAGAASSIDMQQQLPQLQPVLKLWQQLTAALPASLRELVCSATSSSGAPSQGLTPPQTSGAAAPEGPAAAGDSPMAVFVTLEREFGARLLRQVAQTLSGIEAALKGDGQLVTSTVQVGFSKAERP